MTDIQDVANSPVVEAVEAVAQTIATPTLSVLAEDLLLVHSLVSDVKAKLMGKSPTLSAVFNTLFNLG